MRPTRRMAQKRNLLLAFDAFGTLFHPKRPIAEQYGEVARRHGIECLGGSQQLKESFGKAFKSESGRNPNYGKATGLGAEKWWANVITDTFQPFLKSGQAIPPALIKDLLTRFSTSEGYELYPDVLPFFQAAWAPKHAQEISHQWGKVVVGVITNSDSRVPSILESFGLKVGPRRVGASAPKVSKATTTNDISFVVLSYDVGHEKPDRRIFNAAVDMLDGMLDDDSMGREKGCTDDYQKMYIGDSLEKDYFGARSAGWDALLLEREHKYESDRKDKFQVERFLDRSVDDKGNVSAREVYMIRSLETLIHLPLLSSRLDPR